MKSKYHNLIVLLIIPYLICANNIEVTNTRLTGQGAAKDFTLIEFDLNWENSWRMSTGPSNWDAAWVFVKYSADDGNTWHHAFLNNDGHSAGSGTSPTLEIALLDEQSAFNTISNPVMGVFVHRDSDGSGEFSTTDMYLRWNYGANGLDDADIVQLKVFAIEMVYVPEAAFYLGSGGSEFNHFYQYPTTSDPYLVTSESEISVGTNTGDLYCIYDNKYTGDQSGPIPAAFPKGYAGFYCMKYEISQGQYANFLSTLTTTQAINRYNTTLSSRYAITDNSGVYYSDSPGIACNYISWMDGCAYADWAGLRPMTELEFEKACRGTEATVANEYAWGTTAIPSAQYTLENTGEPDENIATNYSTTGGNCIYKDTQLSITGPLRVGIFSANALNTGRVTSGATFYGIMEMSGNVLERTVTVGNANGRAYTGTHGDGSLTTDGYANNSDWPGYGNGKITTATGAGERGGNWNTPDYQLQTSSRPFADRNYTARGFTNGFRAIRTAP